MEITQLLSFMQNAAVESIEGIETAVRSLGFALVFFVSLIISLLIKIGYIGMAIWSSVLWPDFVRHASITYAQKPVRSIFFGCINTLGLLVLIAVCIETGKLWFLGFMLLIVLIWAGIVGYSLAYRCLGERILSSSPSSPIATTAVGAFTAEAAFLVPFVGQLLSLGVFFRGLGAVTLTLLSRRKTKTLDIPETDIQTDDDTHPTKDN